MLNMSKTFLICSHINSIFSPVIVDEKIISPTSSIKILVLKMHIP